MSSRLKMILAFILPVAIVVLIGLLVHTIVFLYNGENDIKEDLIRSEVEHAVSIRQVTSEISRQVNLIAELYEEGEPQSFFDRDESFTAIPSIYAIGVAFDPEFLKQKQEGRFADYKLTGPLPPKESKTPCRYYSAVFRDVHEPDELQRTEMSNSKYETNEWYLLAKLASQGRWCDPFNSSMENIPVFSYSCPFYHKSVFAGVVFAEIPLETFQNDPLLKTRQLIPSQYGGAYFILADNGKIIAQFGAKRRDVQNIYSHIDSIGRSDLFPKIDQLLSMEDGTTQINLWPYSLLQDNERLSWFVSTPLKGGMNCVLLAMYDQHMVLSQLRMEVFFMWIGGLLLTGILGLIIYLTFNSIFRPIYEITKVAKQVIDGNLDSQVNSLYVNKHSDIGLLALAFNNMITNLKDHIHRTVEEESKRKVLERDLDIAHEIQQSFLPHKPQFISIRKDFWLDVAILPAKEVAGDFFDYWMINENKIAFLIADVSGKGVPAALSMIATRTLIRQVSEQTLSPGEIISSVNRIMQPTNEKAMFVTLFLGVFNTETGTLVYTNAGHNPPLLVRHDQAPQWFAEPTNPVVGIFPDYDFTNETLQLDPGDLLFLYTDGVTDTTAASGERFGDQRLFDTVAQLAVKPEKELVNHMVDTLKEFSGPVQQDDITIMPLKRLL